MIGTKGNVRQTGMVCMKALAVSTLLTVCFFWQGRTIAWGAEKPERLMSATYCSDAWVVNFWNSESIQMETELSQIKADGFNSIILVVPWREFQPTTNPISYNPYAWEKLHRVMEAAREQELWVVLRVGYTWDYYGEGSILKRYEALLYEQGSTKDAWMDYTKKLYQEASGYPNFYGGFLTWEDFWNFTDRAGTAGSGKNSIDLSKKTGYQAYLEKNYMLEAVSQIYQTEFASYEKVYLPDRNDYAYLLFYQFYDDFLCGLLTDTQQTFPGITMEVRLDVDPVSSEDGRSQIGVPHYQTFSCGDADITAAMYSVSMGHGFGSELEAEETVETLKQQLAVMRMYNGGKSIYLDQFLYLDTTEEFSHNAHLKQGEHSRFLTMSAPVLRTMSMGYGIWTYRNYTDNAVYNPQFALGSAGWNSEGGVAFVEHDGSMTAKIQSAGAGLWQDLTARLRSRKEPIQVSFNVDCEKQADLTVSIGKISKIMTVNGKQQIKLNFGNVTGGILRFEASGTVWIDNVNVYSYEQDGQLYQADGKELSCLEAMRELNAAMSGYES